MPGKVKVKILAGRNLPVMDRSSDTTDAYVEIKLGNTTYKTDVCRKSLNPQWNSEWYRFEVDDSELQDEPLQLRLMDHDTYSANDAIGKVYLDLNPLLLPAPLPASKSLWNETTTSVASSSGSVMSGWIPVYDTMHGIRGEVNIIVKVELFSDFNRFRQSSCGVQFFCSPAIPQGFHAQVIHGFVEELVVNDDPEYQWIDKIRTPRASNEARQTLFFKLSGEVQRKIGLKALDLGGNAVIGYHQCFDLEGESGIVARGIGTAVSLVRLHEAVPGHGSSLNTSTHDDRHQFSPNKMATFLCVAPSSPRLCVIPPTPTTNPPGPPVMPRSGDDGLLPVMGPRFPKSRLKKGKKRPVVVVPAPEAQKHLGHRRQGSAPFDLRHHAPYKRQNSTKSLVTDLSDLRNLLQQEDMRQSSASPGSSRILKALRHFPKKVNALRGRLYSDDSDLDTLSCSSTKSLSLDFCRKAPKYQRCSSDSVTAALIRSIMMDAGSGPIDRGGLSRVVESEESVSSAPATPKLNFFASTSEIELGGAKELLRQISSDMEESIAFVESSNASSSCDSLTTEDDVSDSSALGLKDEDSLLVDDDELPQEKINDNIGFLTGSQGIASPGKTGKSRVTFVIGANEILHLDGRHIKSRSLSPRGSKPMCETPRKEGSLSPILIKSSKEQRLKQKEYALGRSSPPMAKDKRNSSSPKVIKSARDKSCYTVKMIKTKSSSASPKICPSEDEVSKSKGVRDFNPFDREFGEAATALKNAPDAVQAESLPQPFETMAPTTPPNTASSNSDSPVPAPVSADSNGGGPWRKSAFDSKHVFPACEGSKDLFLVSGGDKVIDNSRSQSTISPSENEGSAGKKSLDLPLIKETPTHLASSNNVALTVTKENTSQRPMCQEPPTNFSMSKPSECSDIKVAEELGVSDNPVCSLTLDTPRVLSPLHKSRSTTSLACRHDAAQATQSAHSAADGDKEGPLAPSTIPDEERGVSPGPPAQHLLVAHKHSQSPAKLNTAPAIHRRSSDSDLSVTPKGNSLTGSDRSSCTGGTHFRPPMMVLRPPTMNQENLDMLEYPFLTMSKYPPGFIQHIGGTVSSRSVKLLERITNLEEPETRDTWWKELRMEVRSHARALGCNVVLGYAEHTSICDDVCVLSAAGTAAVISLHYNPPSELDTSGGGVTATSGLPNSTSDKQQHHHLQTQQQQSQIQLEQQPDHLQHQTELQQQSSTPSSQPQLVQQQTQTMGLQKQGSVNRHPHDRVTMTTSLDRTDFEKERGKCDVAVASRVDGKSRHFSDGAEVELPSPCYMCHIPYSESSVPFRVKMMKCAMCRRGKVPDVLLTTMEPPEGMPVTGHGCLLQAYVCRPKRDTKGELNAKEISDGLPFLEYELHRMLLNKLKVKGMNAIFGLKVQVSIGERMLVGLATGTAVFLTPLPSPPVPTITAGNSWSDERRLLEVQKTLADTVKKNREVYLLKSHVEGEIPANGHSNTSDTDDSDDDLPDLDLAVGNKDTCVLEVDDNEDVDVISLLMDPHPPDGFHVVNTETVPGLEDMEVVRNLQMFTQIWRAKVAPAVPPTVFSKHFHRMLQSVYFKLRRMVPCALAELQFFVEIPEPDELQLSLLGMAVGLGEVERGGKFKRKQVPPSTSREQLKKDDGDLIFSLEEDVVLEDTTGAAAVAAAAAASAASGTAYNIPSFKPRNKSPHQPAHPQRIHIAPKLRHTPPRERYGVDITPLSYIPGGKIERYLGNLNFFFIRESTCIREGGGLSGFVHSFIAEVLAIVRAHVTALGGNAMVAYFISENVLLHNPHKNQGQCLINVGGDVVYASYYPEGQ